MKRILASPDKVQHNKSQTLETIDANSEEVVPLIESNPLINLPIEIAAGTETNSLLGTNPPIRTDINPLLGTNPWKDIIPWHLFKFLDLPARKNMIQVCKKFYRYYHRHHYCRFIEKSYQHVDISNEVIRARSALSLEWGGLDLSELTGDKLRSIIMQCNYLVEMAPRPEDIPLAVRKLNFSYPTYGQTCQVKFIKGIKYWDRIDTLSLGIMTPNLFNIILRECVHLRKLNIGIECKLAFNDLGLKQSISRGFQTSLQSLTINQLSYLPLLKAMHNLRKLAVIGNITGVVDSLISDPNYDGSKLERITHIIEEGSIARRLNVRCLVELIKKCPQLKRIKIVIATDDKNVIFSAFFNELLFRINSDDDNKILPDIWKQIVSLRLEIVIRRVMWNDSYSKVTPRESTYSHSLFQIIISSSNFNLSKLLLPMITNRDSSDDQRKYLDGINKYQFINYSGGAQPAWMLCLLLKNHYFEILMDAVAISPQFKETLLRSKDTLTFYSAPEIIKQYGLPFIDEFLENMSAISILVVNLIDGVCKTNITKKQIIDRIERLLRLGFCYCYDDLTLYFLTLLNSADRREVLTILLKWGYFQPLIDNWFTYPQRQDNPDLSPDIINMSDIMKTLMLNWQLKIICKCGNNSYDMRRYLIVKLCQTDLDLFHQVTVEPHRSQLFKIIRDCYFFQSVDDIKYYYRITQERNQIGLDFLMRVDGRSFSGWFQVGKRLEDYIAYALTLYNSGLFSDNTFICGAAKKFFQVFDTHLGYNLGLQASHWITERTTKIIANSLPLLIEYECNNLIVSIIENNIDRLALQSTVQRPSRITPITNIQSISPVLHSTSNSLNTLTYSTLSLPTGQSVTDIKDSTLKNPTFPEPSSISENRGISTHVTTSSPPTLPRLPRAPELNVIPNSTNISNYSTLPTPGQSVFRIPPIPPFIPNTPLPPIPSFISNSLLSPCASNSSLPPIPSFMPNTSLPSISPSISNTSVIPISPSMPSLITNLSTIETNPEVSQSSNITNLLHRSYVIYDQQIGQGRPVSFTQLLAIKSKVELVRRLIGYCKFRQQVGIDELSLAIRYHNYQVAEFFLAMKALMHGIRLTGLSIPPNILELDIFDQQHLQSTGVASFDLTTALTYTQGINDPIFRLLLQFPHCISFQI